MKRKASMNLKVCMSAHGPTRFPQNGLSCFKFGVFKKICLYIAIFNKNQAKITYNFNEYLGTCIMSVYFCLCNRERLCSL